ncbi:MAG: hypothetical protein E7296_10150 [Lachnospiraceae bacterium]|jgi:hypothetical protein|nr:hypothetical protein [Lachnospiraceae bacterium]
MRIEHTHIDINTPAIFSIEDDYDLSGKSIRHLNLIMNVIMHRNRNLHFLKKMGIENNSWVIDSARGCDVESYNEEFKLTLTNQNYKDVLIRLIHKSRFGREKILEETIVALIEHKSIFFNNKIIKNTCFCKKLNTYPYSEIYIETFSDDKNNCLYFFHEIGHAILNLYCAKKGLIADREYEEFFANLFGYCAMLDLNLYSIGECMDRIIQKINYHIVETEYLDELYSNPYKYLTWKKKKRLFKRIADNKGIFYPEEIENQIISNEDFFKYPLDSFYSISGLIRIVSNGMIGNRYLSLEGVIDSDVN